MRSACVVLYSLFITPFACDFTTTFATLRRALPFGDKGTPLEVKASSQSIASHAEALPRFDAMTAETRFVMWDAVALAKQETCMSYAEAQKKANDLNQNCDPDCESWERSKAQIEKDLLRTTLWVSGEQEMDRLRRLLQVIAARDITRGYVQGMQYMTAVFMAMTGENGAKFSDEQIYYLMNYFIDDIGVDYFTASEDGSSGGMAGVIRDINFILKDENPEDVLMVRARLQKWMPSFLTALFDTTTAENARTARDEKIPRLWDAILAFKRPGWLALAKSFFATCAPVETGKEDDHSGCLTQGFNGNPEDVLARAIPFIDKNIAEFVMNQP